MKALCGPPLWLRRGSVRSAVIRAALETGEWPTEDKIATAAVCHALKVDGSMTEKQLYDLFAGVVPASLLCRAIILAERCRFVCRVPVREQGVSVEYLCHKENMGANAIRATSREIAQPGQNNVSSTDEVAA